MLKNMQACRNTESEEIHSYLHSNEKLTDLDNRIRINIPQAVTDFEPPLFYPTEKWKKGSRTGFMDLKNAFRCLYRTLICNGYAVNLCDSDEAQIVINWSGKRQFSNDKDRQLYFEHGWIPRWSYQISDRGTNSRSHVAHGYKHSVLSEQKKGCVLEYCRNMHDIFEINADKDKVARFRDFIKGPFLLFPFQLATDFNLRYSNSFFSEYYSRDAKANIAFAQACVDFVEESAISLPVVFKQHPMDRNDLRTHLKIRNKRNILLCNDYRISTNEVFCSGLCRLVISINSNTIHEAAVWNIPSVVLGTLLWNESNEPRPFPKDVSTLDNLVNDAFFDSDIRVSYLFHVIRNQWYLNDFLNPLIVRELVNSRGRCIPYDLRKKLGLEQCVCHISQRATVVAEPRDHLPHTDIRSAATKNWAFDSGERQTAGRLEDIRKDHLNRYQYVADFIKSTSSDTGTIGVLDVFCGNGYGSFLFTNEIEGVVVDAIDGSAEAIEFAKQNFSSEKITYHNAIFPFSSTVPIRPEYDYIVSFESIEHVEDDRRFYEFLLSKLKDNGVLFLSFPNKHKIDLSRNTHLFHFRHYDLQDIESLIRRGSRSVEILQSCGQDVYVLDKDGCKRGLLNESDMVLKRNYEGQFLMVALRKLSRNQAGGKGYVNLQKLDVGCVEQKPSAECMHHDVDALSSRRVRLEVLDKTDHNIDEFITQAGERTWEVFELTQSQDVREWIKAPSTIDIFSTLLHLYTLIKDIPRPVSILDVGCYGGYLYDFLKSYVFDSVEEFRYHGIDINRPSVEYARRYHHGCSNAKFEAGDIYSLTSDFPPNSFDIVCCYRVLIHLPYFKNALLNLYSVASRFVHVALKIADKDNCIKYRETDPDKGIESTYFFRYFSRQYINQVLNDLNIKYRLVTEFVCPKGFESYMNGKSRKYDSLILLKGTCDEQRIKLEFGCGKKQPQDGFIGVDIRKFKHVKYVCNAWEIEKFIPKGTVTEIYSRHFFEHLTFAQADLTLQAWNRILVPSGMLRIIVPDIEYHIKQFLTPNSLTPSETNPKWTVLEHALAGFWGWQNEGEEKFWDVHKSGYDFRCLEMKLLQHGFSDIRRIDDKPWNLNVICKTDIAKQMGENGL